MQLVEDDGLQPAEQLCCIRVAEHERQLLRSGQQHIWRPRALALAHGRAGVARARFDADVEAKL
jgi:hypothetical protein